MMPGRLASLFIGSYSIPSPWAGAPDAHGAGICRAELDTESGALAFGPRHDEINPSFLVRNRPAGFLWAITEPEFGGDLVCFREDETGALSLVGRLPTGADAPCHLAVDWGRQLAFIAHYHGGRVATLGLTDTGAPERRLALAAPPARKGQGAAAARSRPHASLALGEDELLVTDTGRDLVLLYRILSTGGLELLDALQLAEGAGPRHMALHPGGVCIYVSNQNSGGVSIIARERMDAGPHLALRGVVSAPTLGRERPIPSEIAVHPTAGVVYMANRHDDSLSIFSIETDSGGLAPRGSVDIRGRNPRHFGISPDGRCLVVANQDSSDLATFHIGDGGRNVTWTGMLFAIPTPTAICF